jgi:hydroxymethylbilane synthase
MNALVIGSRGSPLALAQVEIVRGMLANAHPGLKLEVKIIKTSGDQFNNLSLTAGGGKGLFTKEIEDQLLRGEIHVAVHSMKDLPTVLPDGLTIGAVPPREDAHDVLVAKHAVSFDALAQGAVVGTSSIRRRAQLLARRPDLHIVEIRGNVETRLRKLIENPTMEAIVLAAAGLNRLNLWNQFGELSWHDLEHDVMIPAVGQGAIACEVRENDDDTIELLAVINDETARVAVEAERAFLRAMGGGCQVPYAAHATVDAEEMFLIAASFDPNGKNAKRAEAVGLITNPREIGERAAKQILG